MSRNEPRPPSAHLFNYVYHIRYLIFGTSRRQLERRQRGVEEKGVSLHLGNSTGFLSILDFTAWPGRLALFVWEAGFVFVFVVAYGSVRTSCRPDLCLGGKKHCALSVLMVGGGGDPGRNWHTTLAVLRDVMYVGCIHVYVRIYI